MKYPIIRENNMNDRIDKFIEVAETSLYFIIALLLLTGSVFLIYEEILEFFKFGQVEDPIIWIVEIIAKTLLIMMIIEILYTIRVSLREHVLNPEPFLIVALIAAIRRILIISVETAYLHEYFNLYMIEISILGGLILIFIIALFILNKIKQINTPE